MSEAWLAVWAKSVRDDHNAVTEWLPLSQHLDDTAGVASQLVDHWLSPQVLSRIAADLPEGVSGVRPLVSWLAGVHDVGKASPAFAVQVPALSDHMRDHGFSIRPQLADHPDRRHVSHSLVGHVAVQDWLVSELGFPRRASAIALASVVGSHHGVPPEQSGLTLTRQRDDFRGVGLWEETRRLFLERATTAVGGREVLSQFRDVQFTLPTLVLLTAVVILADWIASNTELFPLQSIATLRHPLTAPPDAVTAQRVKDAWERLALPSGWVAQPVPEDLDSVMRDRFALTGNARPVQVAAVRAAARQTKPGMIIVEAPMGVGKTEAALLAAEQLASKTGADGCFVALPTQATSDAMFARVNTWLEHLPRSGKPFTVNLAHGKAHLNETYLGLMRAARLASIGEDDEQEAVAHQWLRGRKKSLLASFVVGTIDQLLFAGLRGRHLMLRHLGLASKVVIIDEVHAYDVYMSQYLHRVLRWLGAYQVPVVLLSATLPAGRRADLLRAYDSATPLDEAGDLGYPVVLATGQSPERLALPERGTEVHVDHVADDLDSLVGYLRDHLSEGGCAAVVRNTVGRVQETADRLISEFGDDHVTVAHSRFLACDRARLDRELLRRFGPPSAESDRPRFHIVVASQVIEQSLDVDFDLLVTDLAPTDLVLQRLGRLHRHDRTRPDRVRTPRCALVGVTDWKSDPTFAVPGSRRIYGDDTLLRAAALFRDRGTVRLPHDISDLVQQAYGDDELGPSTWREAMAAAREEARLVAQRRAEAAKAFLLDEPKEKSLIGWLRGNVGAPDDTHAGLGQVRDGEESLEVLVVQRDADGGLLTPAWIEHGASQQIPLDQEMPVGLARTVAACSLRLPQAMSHPGVIDDVIAALERNYFTSFQQSPLLKDQLVLVLDESRRATVQHGSVNFALTYDPLRGLVHEQR
ncbi:CRISPR-associated helicase Cas3' [Amycolatopsis cynarae]|uniref:CRISPR-associated helicase Cas3 n=1 Tax=Amycolatopsis cynarae TaxID=2995223 RepID=A0ABY7B111_9PSEU|nr:CRISPR-associated helicase Cas3' [Amycolatopsis sp. HUAS 11-8]WAL65970.1 CRISPR-associated helicase Cas3' [Amycolatopsis sp. HUAS 11-8]